MRLRSKHFQFTLKALMFISYSALVGLCVSNCTLKVFVFLSTYAWTVSGYTLKVFVLNLLLILSSLRF